MQFSNCRLKLDVESAFSLVENPNAFIYERLLSTLAANVARVALSQTFFDLCASFSAQFGTHGIHVFWCTATIGTLGRRAESGVGSASFLRVGVLVSACTFPHPSIVVDRSSTDLEKSCDFVPTSGFTFGDNVTHFCDSFQCSRMLRTVEHLFLLASSNFFAWLREGLC